MQFILENWSKLLVLLWSCFILSCSGVPVRDTHRPPFKGMYCDLILPPASSGDGGGEGVLAKVFPRHTAVSKDFTGCQYVWVKDERRFTLERARYFEDGKLRFTWWLQDGGLPPVLCEYREGVLATQETTCHENKRDGLEKSLAPGCIEHLMQTGVFRPDCYAE
jgi:hypothetical protein